MLKQLDGYKTYILVSIAIASTIGYNYGIVQYDAWQTILTICGFGAVATIKSSLKK